MKRLSGYSNWFYPLLINTLLLMSLSGLFMLPWVAEFKLQWDVSLDLGFGYRQGSALIHVLFSWLMLILLGALWHSHMRGGWRKKRNHISGIVQASSLLVLAISGLGLYYLGSENAQLYASLIHCGLGLILIFSFIWHYLHGMKINRRQAQGHRRGQHNAGLKPPPTH
jgi:hypothetical protein